MMGCFSLSFVLFSCQNWVWSRGLCTEVRQDGMLIRVRTKEKRTAQTTDVCFPQICIEQGETRETGKRALAVRSGG